MEEDTKQAYLLAYDEHADALFRYCVFKVGDRELAKDLLQNTFVKTWEYLAEGQRVLNMKAFLYKTANNLIIDEYRKKKSVSLDRMQEDGFDPGFNEEERTVANLDGKKALEMLKQVPEAYREALFMRYVEELELSEIAAITGEAENTISVRLYRGIKKLKELFPYE